MTGGAAFAPMLATIRNEDTANSRDFMMFPSGFVANNNYFILQQLWYAPYARRKSDLGQ
jgi:hypothetical protein